VEKFSYQVAKGATACAVFWESFARRIAIRTLRT